MPGTDREHRLRAAVSDSVTFGSVAIPYRVEFRARKHIGITVKPDMRVIVAAPEGTSIEVVRQRVRRRAPWIIRQLDHFERFRPRPTPRQYLSGETFRYLGRQYRLKVAIGTEPSVKLLGRYLKVEVPNPKDSAEVCRHVEAWYRTHARPLFERRFDLCLAKLTRLKINRPPVVVRRMKSRWGSCSKAGRILLNSELVQAPVECIDYVIVHELCHLKIADHSPSFYRLLTNCMPDWQRRKERLEGLRL